LGVGDGGGLVYESSMSLTRFLDKVAQAEGADALHGAMVFVMLERPIDEMISRGLSQGPHHRGTPSPWSHCVLLAEPYRGSETRILDCCIRDARGGLLWDVDAKETLSIIFESTVGKGAGAIYDGRVADYDHARVKARGIKWLPELGRARAAALVAAAEALQAKGIRYDLPGLLREMSRLFVGLTIPPQEGRLFCSAFLQKVYSEVLGADGDFADNVRDEDTTPEDIWYSSKGLSRMDS
jgi:hypothetical protein